MFTNKLDQLDQYALFAQLARPKFSSITKKWTSVNYEQYLRHGFLIVNVLNRRFRGSDSEKRDVRGCHIVSGVLLSVGRCG